jgi:hypothetical protein
MICPGLSLGVRNVFRMVEDDRRRIRDRTFLLAEHNEMRLRNCLYFPSPEINKDSVLKFPIKILFNSYRKRADLT